MKTIFDDIDKLKAACMESRNKLMEIVSEGTEK
jgi:hypothetical protein